MTDLNTAIALSKGYKFGQPVSGMNRDIWYETFPDSGWFETKCPDHEHDARLYMALAVEMMEKYEIRLGADGNEQKYCELYEYDLEYDLPVFISSDQADDLGTAICMAYCKLKGIEVVG
jgi:hypothetical protein